MEEKGCYTSYEGRIILCENQQWILDKVLAKVLHELANNHFRNIPNVATGTTTSSLSPYKAPFKQEKRFPSTGKYIRVGIGSVWYKHFRILHDLKDKNHFGFDIEDILKVILFDMGKDFFDETDMFNRESFEKTMNIQWTTSK